MAELDIRPNLWSVVADQVSMVVDVRAPSDAEVAGMFSELRRVAESVTAQLGVSHRSSLVRAHPAQPFDSHLVDMASLAIEEVGARPNRLLSGAMHDATVVSRVVPAVMVFVASIGGVSHTAAENSHEADLRLGVLALARLADLVLAENEVGEARVADS